MPQLTQRIQNFPQVIGGPNTDLSTLDFSAATGEVRYRIHDINDTQRTNNYEVLTNQLGLQFTLKPGRYLSMWTLQPFDLINDSDNMDYWNEPGLPDLSLPLMLSMLAHNPSAAQFPTNVITVTVEFNQEIDISTLPTATSVNILGDINTPLFSWFSPGPGIYVAFGSGNWPTSGSVSIDYSAVRTSGTNLALPPEEALVQFPLGEST